MKPSPFGLELRSAEEPRQSCKFHRIMRRPKYHEIHRVGKRRVADAKQVS